MYNGKKITREDTWRSEELIRHIRSQEEESRRRERSHRDPERERGKNREESGRRGEERDEREKESSRGRGETQYREREKERQRDVYKDRDKVKEKDRNGERVKERDREKELEREKRNREKEREKNKERDREKDREREKRDREKEREREKRDREKEREREKRDREKEREREKGDREKDREREKRDRGKEREREQGDREKDRDRQREKERDRAREAVRDRGEERDREKDREKERRRAERENERRTQTAVSLDVGDKSREKEKDRKERHRAREHHHGGEEKEREWREHERREKHGHRQHMGQTDGEERRERRRREKEQHVQFNHEERELELEPRHRRQDGDGAREKEQRDKLRDQRHEIVHRKTLQEVESDVIEDSHQGAEDYGNEEYEDDFEDYEEDFEEFDEDKEEKEREEEEEEEEEVCEDKRREVSRELSPRSRREVEAIQRAMEKENELLSTAHSISSTQETEMFLRASVDSESHSRKSRTYGRVIDFNTARQREINQQVADKQKKRSTELLRLIDLDFSVTESLLDLPPVREYDLYIKSYGMANTKQAYVQCNEDNVERDTQTDETDITDTWTQHPPESSVACGGPQVSQNASDETVTRTTVDSKRLAAFLRSATQVMAVLLEENIAESKTAKLQSQTHTYSFSDGCVQLNTKLNFLQGRQVTLLHFSQTQTHTLLSVHSPCSGSGDVTLNSKTLICVWNIWEPSTPQRILVYEAEVRSCCFSPGKATLVFAGTDVGSVLVWDLREHSGSHSHIRVCEEEWTLRHPTFSTDAVLSGVGHFSPVVSVEPVLVNVGAGLRDPLLPDQEESLGLSFQLGSLDENGLLNLWVVVELPKAEDSGSQTDLGLRPGGKVKLLHSSSLQTTPRVDKGVLGVTSHLSFVLKFLPSDFNHYFIGSNMGLVRHGTRHGLQAAPKLYRPKDGERPAEVTALEFCPAGEPFFLVGCSDGSVRLHALPCDEAVCEWIVGSGHSSVQCVQFSPTRCSVFCVLDSASVLHIWDLTQRDESPFITQDLHTDPVSAMAAFGDDAKRNPYSGIALAKRSGSLEIHFLLPSLTIPQGTDTEKLHSLTRDAL